MKNNSNLILSLLIKPTLTMKIKQKVRNFLSNTLKPSPSIQPILTNNIIQKLRIRKPFGYDGISNNVLKQLPTNCIHYITKLTN